MKFIAIICLLMVFILADFMVFNHGIDSFFWQYKTPIELEFQKQILEERKAKRTPPVQPSKLMVEGQGDDQAA
jgi:hypothetical protein